MSVGDYPFTCDAPSCGKRRQNDTNNWFVLWETEWEGTKGVVIFPWLAEEAAKPGRKHACGVNCALTLMERKLTLGTFQLEKEKP